MLERVQRKRPGIRKYDSTVALVATLGVLSGGIAVLHTLTHPEPVVPWGIELVMGIVPTAVLLYAAWWLTAHRPLESDRRRLTRSALIGACGIGALAALYTAQAVLTTGFHGDLVLLVTASTAAGAVIGLTAAIVQSTSHHVTFETPVSNEPSATGTHPGPLQTGGLSCPDRTLSAVLADQYLVALVRTLAVHDGPLPEDELASSVARETGVDEGRARRRLHHVTVPKAESVGVVSVDPVADRIASGPELDAVVTALDLDTAHTGGSDPERTS